MYNVSTQSSQLRTGWYSFTCPKCNKGSSVITYCEPGHSFTSSCAGDNDDDIEDLLYETMNEVWNSRVPPMPGIEYPEYLLDPATVMDKFVHLGNYLKKSDEGLKREACLAIIRIPTFLYLLADIMKKQIEGTYLNAFLFNCMRFIPG